MKLFIKICVVLLILSFNSCAFTEDYSPPQYVVSLGTPYYYNGIVQYYVYKNKYYYPYYINGRRYFYHRPYRSYQGRRPRYRLKRYD